MLTRHTALLEMLTPAHMSGDETDGEEKTHPRRFRIINAAWQSIAMKTFLRLLDRLYREDWKRPLSGQRAISGNEPRFRYESHESRCTDSQAPVGLWKNCYDDGWLSRLKSPHLDELCIIEEDYDFGLDAVKALVKKCSGVENCNNVAEL